jgi:hypothetical protein
MDELIYFGGSVKTLEEGHIGGYLVLFGDEQSADLEGEFFTKQTDFDIQEGQKTAVYFNHRLPIKTRDGGKLFVKEKIGEGTLTIDDKGVFIDAVLYNRALYEDALDSCGWSSGTAPHLVDKEKAGKSYWLKRWPLGLDASVTPTPCNPDPQNKAITLKSYADSITETATKGMFEDMLSERTNNLYFLNDLFMSGCYQLMYMDDAAEMASVPFDIGQKFDELSTEFIARVRAAIIEEDQEEDSGDASKAMLKSVKSAVSALPLNRHSEAMVSVCQEFATQTAAMKSLIENFVSRSKQKQEFRIKEGRTISQATRGQVSDMKAKLKEAHTHITDVMTGMQDLITEPQETTDHMKSVDEIKANLMRRRTTMRHLSVA